MMSSKSSRKKPSEPLPPKVSREICVSSKQAVADLQETGIEDLQCSLQSTVEVLIKRYKKRDEQFDSIQGQLVTAKEEIKQVTQERNKVSDDYHKTTQELKNTKQVLEQKNDHIRDLETKFDQLKVQLQNLTHEKTEKCEELDGLKQVLQRKEIAVNKFIKEFSGNEQSCGQKVSSKEACDVDGSSDCPICMEPWTESGEHYICSLSCGHFFGRSCITKWINEATLGLSTCPQCQKNASLGDLRQHYVRRICIADENKIYADDRNIPQGRSSLMDSRTVLSSTIESGQNYDLTNEEDEGVDDVGSSNVGGYDIGDHDDEDDNDDEGDIEESDPVSVDEDDDDDDIDDEASVDGDDDDEDDPTSVDECSLEDNDDDDLSDY